MIPQGPGSNMNAGTPRRPVYPLVCFDDSHTQFFLLSCVNVSFTCSQFFLCVFNSKYTDVRKTDDSRTGNRALIFFRQTHYWMIKLQETAWLYICMIKWYFSTSPYSFGVLPISIWTVHLGLIPLPSFGNKLKRKPCPPLFSWMPSRSSVLYISHTYKSELCLVHFSHSQEMLSESILDRLSQENESAMTMTSARCGRLTCTIWSLRFEGQFPLLREVFRDSSGFRL